MVEIKEQEYDEIDYEITIKNKSGSEIPESKFNEFTKKIEEEMSKGDFLVLITKLKPDKYHVKYP